ncbi:MAG: ATP-binding protein [Sphingomonadales bacterium 32-64-17]|nr:MAG: ATP-binding protein [Sphingomonadales bacterium 32-64-17]
MASKRPRDSRGRWFRAGGEDGKHRRLALDKTLLAHERSALGSWHWEVWGRDEQLPPPGAWRIWLICAGRGFGKTRAGAEWVRNVARHDGDARIALVGASLAEVRAVMVEGESGILAASPRALVPDFEPSLKRLTWPNGAQAFLYSAGEPESLRGPQHTHAWCDEIAKWDNAGGRAMDCWDNLQLGMRLGEHPRILATSTPRPVPLMQRLLAEAERGDGSVALARGRTADNAGVLPTAYYEAMLSQFGGSSLGRQELDGEMLREVEGALWTRALLERCRQTPPPHEGRGPGGGGSALGLGEAEAPLPNPSPMGEGLSRIVVGVDPPASARGDECGIIVCGVTPEGMGQVLADHSVGGATPERWASAVAEAVRIWRADRVIAEANQGGDMVQSVLRAADCAMPVKLVHASRGKAARAEPIAALYEAGRVQHIGQFAALEDQLCGLLAGGTYEGPGRSPDRADALVWALSELMLGLRSNPRVQRM